MQDNIGYTFEEGEKTAGAILSATHPLLSQGVQATTELLFATVEAASQMLKNSQRTTIVASQLFMKIYDDFRCASLLGFGGYPTQTASLVASLYESVFTLCYIGNDQVLAQEWAGFKDSSSSFRSVRELTKGGMSNIFDMVTTELVDKEYSTYQQLCMAKHGNPIFQKTQGFVKQGRNVTLTFGPKTLDSSQHVIRYSLAKSMMYTAWACSALGKFHIEENETTRVLLLRERVLAILEKLAKVIADERNGV